GDRDHGRLAVAQESRRALIRPARERRVAVDVLGLVESAAAAADLILAVGLGDGRQSIGPRVARGHAEVDLKRGKYRGPLHGIPWGAKDLFATKGIKTTWGAEPYREQVIDYDATVVERLANAGAVLVAKLSMGALAQGARWFAGVTRNPWNPNEDRFGGSSGSSAGPASATAAGLVGFSIGTETRGSIMSPSSTCGVTGLRPTYGRVSRYGAMGLSWTMDKIGAICRGVEDCAAVLDTIYGPDSRDVTVGDAPFNWSPDVPSGNLRVGYLKTEFENVAPPNATEQQRRLNEQRNAMYKEALAALERASVKMSAIELPKF